MLIIKTKIFAKWAKDNQLTDLILIKAVKEMVNGIVEVDLGGGIYKKRIALANKGKSGGSRVIELALKNKELVEIKYDI